MRSIPQTETSTSYVTVSAGGNDLGWSAVIVQCAKPWPYTCWGDIDRAEAYIRNTLPGQLDQLYSTIRSRAPNARLIAVGYPRLFNGQECNAIARISPGHAVCGSPEWINGTSWPVSESYHPNRAGQVGYANIVESAIRAVLK